MPTIPRYALGRTFTLTIQGYTLSAGTLTLAGTAVTLTTKKKGFKRDQLMDEEDINSDASTVKNMVTLADDQAISIDVLQVNDGTDPSPLETLFLTYEYFKLTWVVGTGASLKTKTAIVKRSTLAENSSGRGAILCTANFTGCDVDTGYFTVT